MQNIALLRAVKVFKTQRALAKALKVSPARLNNWINRDDSVPLQYALMIDKLTHGSVSYQELISSTNQVQQKDALSDRHRNTPLSDWQHLLVCFSKIEQLFVEVRSELLKRR